MERVYAVYELLAIELKARFQGVRVPLRLVIIHHNSRLRHHSRQHVRVLKLMDALSAIFPGPGPFYV